MAGHARALSQTIVVGANHRTSPLAVRDRLFVDEAAMPAMLTALRAAGIEQAVVLSTCDRVEVAAVAAETDGAAGAIASVLARHAGLTPAEVDGQVFEARGGAALRHLFGVAASLESLIVGEPHVLGQVKAGHRAARRRGMVGTELETVLQAAYAAAKRVRTETGIGRRAVSIAAAAVELARDLHGDLGRCRGLVVGAGDMGELIAEAMRSGGLGDLAVTHPRPARAEPLARALACHVVRFDDLGRALVDADIVIAALGGRQCAVTADMVRAAIRKRRNRPVFLVDAAVPGDVDSAVERVDSAFRYSLEDLERVALDGRAHREQEAEAAWRIIDEELEGFTRGTAERAAAPVLGALRAHFERAREAALADAGGNAEKATRLLVARLLHAPSLSLRALAATAQTGELDAVERVLAEVFAFEAGGGDPETDGE